eukprot:SAG11_NODE_46488_length_136_cov_21.648649_1_plen_20_part_10
MTDGLITFSVWTIVPPKLAH